MFPNPQEALPLPPHPNLEQYKKQAKDLVKACHSSDPDAIRAWTEHWVETLVRLANLTITPQLPVRIERWVELVEEFARRKLSNSDQAKCSLTTAQFVVARSHGFESWPKFASHLEGTAQADSPVSSFELAADAIITGDTASLKRLLRENPDLIHTRSTREHRAALLHYVSANGVEGYRQNTPPNAGNIAETLLQAGADVNAAANVYGGLATTLSLVATSIHPWLAGVQNELMDLLLRHGATLDGVVTPDDGRGLLINASLANGRAEAAEFLAQRGAPLDLAAASGTGRLEAVKSFFRPDGSLDGHATKEQLEQGFLWACEYGRNSIVEFLLQQGGSLLARTKTGQTGLHSAVIGGQMDTIKLLIARGASLKAKNAYGGTALGQAMWSAVHGSPRIDYPAVVETLILAGAGIEDGSLAWLEQERGGYSSRKLQIAEILKRHGAKSHDLIVKAPPAGPPKP